MKTLAILIFFYFLTSFSCRLLPENCGHAFLAKKYGNQKQEERELATTNYFSNATIKAEKDRISAGQKGLFANTRIQFDYQFFNTSLLNETQLDFFQNTLLSAVQNYYESTIKVFPRNKTIYPPSSICSSLGLNLSVNSSSLKNGYNNTDVVIYVVGENTKSENYLAWASTCNKDSDLFSRPLIGLVNCNFYYLDWVANGFDSTFKTLAHELFHFFVFSSNLYQYYVSEEGVTLGVDQVVKADGTKYKIILNGPTAFGQKFYNCDTLDGIWLEDGDSTSNGLGSHWEDTFFRDEMMSPVDRPNKKISNFSISLLGSSGWYIVNYDNMQDYLFGYQEGCNFLDLGCKNVPMFPEYCSSNLTIGCQEDYKGVGVCWYNSFSNYGCSTFDTYPIYLCSDNTNANFSADVKLKGGAISANSYCFPSTLINTTYKYKASCYIAQCFKNSSTQLDNIAITINGTVKNCYSDGQLLKATYFQGNLTCPNITRFCQYYQTNCLNGCNSGKGICSTGAQCHYYKGEGVCSSNCSSCLNSSYCQVCEAGNFLHNTEPGIATCSSSECESSQYYNKTIDQCFECDSSCLSCNGPSVSNCTACLTGKYILNQSCFNCSSIDSNCNLCNYDSGFQCSECQDSFFINSSNLCQPCSATCLTCDGNSSDSCLSCYEGLYLDIQTCSPCDSSCVSCSGPLASDCLTCEAIQHVNGSNFCVDNDCSSIPSCLYCQKNSSTNLICSKCIDGYFMNNNTSCSKCNSKCLTCSGGAETECLSCALGAFLQSSSCLNCDVSCMNCTGPSNSSQNCSNCSINYAFNDQNECERLICDSTCKDCIGKTANDCYSCPDGRFLNKTSSASTCDICSENCSTCSGPTETDCLACQQGLNLIDGSCKNISVITIDDITSAKSIEGLENLTSTLNSSNNSLLTQSILSKINDLTSGQNSTNLTSSDMKSLGDIITNLITISATSNSTWNSSFTTDTISIIKNISSSFSTLANSSVSLDASTVNTYMNALASLQSLNSNTSDSSTQKQNEQNLLIAAKTIIASNLYVLSQNSSVGSLSSTTSLCNFQITSIPNNTNTTTIKVAAIDSNNGSPSINITQSFLASISKNGTIVQMIQWKENPYQYRDTSNTSNISSFVSIDFYTLSNSSFSNANLTNLSQNKTFILPIPKDQVTNNEYSYECIYWNESLIKWDNKSMGVNSSTSDQLICFTNHFSDFAYRLVLVSNNSSTISTNKTGNSTDKKKLLYEFLLIFIVFVMASLGN